VALSEENDNSNLLQEHRKLMLLTGKFSDFQVKNLELYPKIVFDNIKKIEIQYDIQTNTGSGFVKYKVKLKKPQEGLEKRIDDLKTWVRQLLFKIIFCSLTVRRNGKA
jgi:5'-3' exonuclease